MNEPASFVQGSPSNTCPNSKWDNELPYFPSKSDLKFEF